MDRWINSGLLVLGVISLGMLLQSCSNDEPLPHADYSSAIQLRKGNYWIYESASSDISSGIRIRHLDDSIFVANDTIVGNSVYFIVKNMFGLHEIKKAMSGMIVGIDGAVEFSATNFVDTLFKDSDLGYYGIMAKEEAEITVPAGTFSTISFILLKRNDPTFNVPITSNNPSIHSKEFSILKKVWYARNIGVIKSASYYGNKTSFERELKRFNVQ